MSDRPKQRFFGCMTAGVFENAISRLRQHRRIRNQRPALPLNVFDQNLVYRKPSHSAGGLVSKSRGVLSGEKAPTNHAIRSFFLCYDIEPRFTGELCVSNAGKSNLGGYLHHFTFSFACNMRCTRAGKARKLQDPFDRIKFVTGICLDYLRPR